MVDPGFPGCGGGSLTPEAGAKTYYLVNCVPKTA